MEIDNGIFQLVTMALLGVTLLVLVVTLLTLGKLGKRLEELSPGFEHSNDHAHPHLHDGGADHAHEHESGRDDEHAEHPVATQEEPAPETVGAAPVAASESGDGYTRQDEGHGKPEAATEEGAPQPVAEQQQEPVATEQQQEPVAAEREQAATGFEDAPSEQPFERDGRWWFKRGDEILVYDEQTGQWGPAPVGVTGTSGAAAPAQDGAGWGGQQAEGQAQVADTEAAPEQTQGWGQPDEAQQQDEPAQSSFWKCPSCGAVNGATASACRMCFTPKA